MFEESLLICGPGLEAAESKESLQRLKEIGHAGATKVVVTTGKFETDGAAKRINVDADYPPEPAHLQTLLSWAALSDLSDSRFRDGFDLYSLRRILAKHGQADFALLLRSNAAEFNENWPKLRSSLTHNAFKCFGGDGDPRRRNLIVNLRASRIEDALEAAWQIYFTGAVYALAPYSLDAALDAAVAATTAYFQPAESQFRAADTPRMRGKTG